jgi:hypothetical protein
MQKNMIAKLSDDIDMIFKIYMTSVQMGDYDTADYIADQGYHDRFSEDQMQQVVALLEIVQAEAELAVIKLESELGDGQPSATIH